MFICKLLIEMSSMSTMSTPELIAAFRSRDFKALECLVKEYTEMLLKGALGLGFRDQQADDLVQSVWETFFDVASTFEGKSQLKTFLFGIMINKAREQRRDQKRDANHDPIDQVMEERFDTQGHWSNPPMAPDRFVDAVQKMNIIQDCLELLPVNQRAAFCLREVEDLESPEICKMLDVSVTNLGVLLFRAKNRLRECVEKKVGGK